MRQQKKRLLKYQLAIFFKSFVMMYLIGIIAVKEEAQFFLLSQKYLGESRISLFGNLSFYASGIFYGNIIDNLTTPKKLLLVLELITALSFLSQGIFCSIVQDRVDEDLLYS